MYAVAVLSLSIATTLVALTCGRAPSDRKLHDQLKEAALGDKHNCTRHTSATTCIGDPKCDWCGNITEPTPYGLCYDRFSTFSCCVFSNQSVGYFCSPSPTMCSAQQVCILWEEDTGYGLCGAATCCPPNQTKVCEYSGCGYQNRECCGVLGQCEVGYTCCGGGSPVVGSQCCKPNAQCCGSADGYSNWCCDEGTQCDYDAGTCTPMTSTPGV